MPGGAPYTYADLVAEFPEDNIRREIIDGELIVAPSPVPNHHLLSSRINDAFRDHLRAHGGGAFYYAPLDVVLSDTVVVQPDLIFIAPEQAEIVGERHVRGVPALLIEILSEDTRRDRITKRDVYASFGVPTYWIVDPYSDRVEVYVLGDGGYAKPEIFETGETLTYDRLPGLAIDLAEIFAR